MYTVDCKNLENPEDRFWYTQEMRDTAWVSTQNTSHNQSAKTNSHDGKGAYVFSRFCRDAIGTLLPAPTAGNMTQPFKEEIPLCLPVVMEFFESIAWLGPWVAFGTKEKCGHWRSRPGLGCYTGRRVDAPPVRITYRFGAQYSRLAAKPQWFIVCTLKASIQSRCSLFKISLQIGRNCQAVGIPIIRSTCSHLASVWINLLENGYKVLW